MYVADFLITFESSIRVSLLNWLVRRSAPLARYLQCGSYSMSPHHVPYENIWTALNVAGTRRSGLHLLGCSFKPHPLADWWASAMQLCTIQFATSHRGPTQFWRHLQPVRGKPWNDAQMQDEWLRKSPGCNKKLNHDVCLRLAITYSRSFEIGPQWPIPKDKKRMWDSSSFRPRPIKHHHPSSLIMKHGQK
jgi:hypothetical protein